MQRFDDRSGGAGGRDDWGRAWRRDWDEPRGAREGSYEDHERDWDEDEEEAAVQRRSLWEAELEAVWEAEAEGRRVGGPGEDERTAPL
jgi:hypothetical protein